MPPKAKKPAKATPPPPVEEEVIPEEKPRLFSVKPLNWEKSSDGSYSTARGAYNFLVKPAQLTLYGKFCLSGNMPGGHYPRYGGVIEDLIQEANDLYEVSVRQYLTEHHDAN